MCTCCSWLDVLRQLPTESIECEFANDILIQYVSAANTCCHHTL